MYEIARRINIASSILFLESKVRMKLIINERNLTQLSKVRDWRHLSSSKSLREELISQLSKEQLNGVYENYKIDFEMFNYTMDKYLH